MSGRSQVVHLRHTFTDGGAERMLLNWFGHYDRESFEFSLVCFANPDGSEACLTRPAADLDVPTYTIPWGRRKRLFSAVQALVRLLRERSAQVIHSHDTKSDLVAWLAHLETGVPVVGAAYGWFGNRSAKRLRIYEWLGLRLLARFNAVVAISESLLDESVKLGLNPNLIHVVRTGIDYDDLQRSIDRESLRKNLGLAPDDIALVNLARLWPEKGQSCLLSAMCKVVARVPKARLVIVGEGPLESRLRSQANDLGLNGHVIMAGFPENLQDLLHAFDAQVHSSIYEGLPIALLQGMAVGLPIVATDVGGIKEVLTSGENSLLVPPEDPDALANGILALLSDEPAARRLGEAARQYVREHYSMQSAMEQLGSVYDRVIRAHENRGSR
jgi:glycosyltransferase involved in cell wall biosynthesis